MSEDAVSSAHPGSDWFRPGRFALMLAVMVFLPFRNVLLGAQTFAVRDFGLFSYPVASFFRESFWRGEWPFWNPLSCCGTPFLAQLNTLTLYPPSLIYLLLPLTWALPFFCLAHLYLGGLGMYFLARRWSGSALGGAVAGTVFAFNGLSLSFLMWPSHIATFALMPWVLWLTEDAWKRGGRAVVVAALAAALQVLAGGPETILLTWLLLLALAASAWQKGEQPRWPLTRRFLTVGLLALGLSAMQLLPFVDLSLHANRSNQFGGSAWSMAPCGWANFLVPLFQATQVQQIVMPPQQFWTSSYYAGIGTVFLAAMALLRRPSPRVLFLSIVLALSLALALGDHGPLFNPLRRVFPFLGLFRYPVKFTLAALCALPLLAAAAVGYYENPSSEARRSWRLEWTAGAILLALIGFLVWFAARWPDGAVPWRAVAENAWPRAMFLLLTVGGLYLLARWPAWRVGLGLALVSLCWLDVLTHEPWQNPTVDPSLYQPGLGALKADFKPAPPLAGASRVMQSPYSIRQTYFHPGADLTTNYLLDRAVFEADCNLLDDVAKVDGFFSLYLRHIDKVLSLFDTNAESRLQGLEDVMAVSQTIAPGKVFDWVPRPSFVPWVSVGQAPVFADEETTLSGLANPANDFHRMIYLPLEAQASVTATRQENAQVAIKKFSATKIVLDIQTPGPAMVSISQAWYHHWEAAVDGKPVPLWRANEAFQAVEAPAGHHEIVLYYEDTVAFCGFWISGISLLLCGLGFGLSRSRLSG